MGTGETVSKGDVLGVVADPFGETGTELVCDQSRVIIGHANLPIVNEGDALFHIAYTDGVDPEAAIGKLSAQLDIDPIFDEDEII